VHYVDGRHFIKQPGGRFDLVIARLPEPTSALRARFCTSEFYGELRHAMSPRGVLCTTAVAMPTRLSAASACYLASIRETLRKHLPQVVVGWGDPAQIVAATTDGLIATDGAELVRRYRQARVTSPCFDPRWFTGGTDSFDPAKIRQRSAELEAVTDAQVSTDLRPIVYMQRLAIWEKMIGGRTGELVERLLSIGWRPVAVALATIGILTLAIFRLRRASPAGWSEGAVILSITTTGFATMALSIIWLFAFQNLYGYVYQWIGWIIAIFMAGLVIGCFWADRRSKRFADRARLTAFLWRAIIAVDVMLACLAAVAPILLPALGRMQTTPRALILVEWSLSLLVVFTGVLGGAAFALAGGLQLAIRNKPGRTAGVVVAADHAGACLGALLTGLLLVPVFGTPTAALLLAGIKLASAVMLAANRPDSASG
jgi:spermidine synthase